MVVRKWGEIEKSMHSSTEREWSRRRLLGIWPMLVALGRKYYHYYYCCYSVATLSILSSQIHTSTTHQALLSQSTFVSKKYPTHRQPSDRIPTLPQLTLPTSQQRKKKVATSRKAFVPLQHGALHSTGPVCSTVAQSWHNSNLPNSAASCPH